MFNSIPENDGLWTRRHLLKAAGALTLGATFARTSQAAAAPDAPAATQEHSPISDPKKKQTPLMRIGILIGTFARPTLEARLDAVKASGLDCVQLSMDCAGLAPMPDEIAPELVGRIRREAAARGITIAAVQGTFNMSHPDAEHRRVGLRRLRVLAAACQQLGTSKIHLCTGTRDRENMWRRHADNDSPEAWRDMAAWRMSVSSLARQTRTPRSGMKRRPGHYPWYCKPQPRQNPLWKEGLDVQVPSQSLPDLGNKGEKYPP